ncbi:hypothetical protein OU994_10830 [Pseudoduganella sp. SL102]|uniref:hypothetical protein n=1 Tax=Pseudoduganella sp. SL102 TaxID=2995154 RepID=UPI00248BBACE|nr:hypothetical protein [Pseudoduganella sp. SL102]WBS04729.1 hypothetical protein OU994_10830 [Pseudoduganella sp. SL102]
MKPTTAKPAATMSQVADAGTALTALNVAHPDRLVVPSADFVPIRDGLHADFA